MACEGSWQVCHTTCNFSTIPVTFANKLLQNGHLSLRCVQQVLKDFAGIEKASSTCCPVIAHAGKTLEAIYHVEPFLPPCRIRASSHAPLHAHRAQAEGLKASNFDARCRPHDTLLGSFMVHCLWHFCLWGVEFGTPPLSVANFRFQGFGFAFAAFPEPEACCAGLVWVQRRWLVLEPP